jgi:predicted permease
VRDLPSVVRGLVRRPVYAGAVIGVLALGVSVNAALFGVTARLVLMSPTGVADPSRVVRVYFARRDRHGQKDVTAGSSYALYSELGGPTRDAILLAAHSERMLPAAEWPGHDLRVSVVTGSYWKVVGVRALKGALFGSSDDAAGSGRPVAVISAELARLRFPGNKNPLGQTLSFRGQAFTIIGVAPASFRGLDPSPTDVWLPFGAIARSLFGPTWSTERYSEYVVVVGRMATGETQAQVDTRLSTLFGDWLRLLGHDARGSDVTVRSIRGDRAYDMSLSANARMAVWLSAVALIVALVMCANVGSLSVLRQLGRRQELAVREALGLTRGRMAWQLCLESAVLSLAGGLIGLGLAAAEGPIITRVVLPDVVNATAVDWPVAMWTVFLSVLSGFLIALAPIALARRMPSSSLSTPRGVTTRRSPWVLRALVGFQVAFTAIAMAGAVASTVSLHRAQSADLGVQPDSVMAAQVIPPAGSVDTDWAQSYYPAVLDRSLALPGVRAASLAVSAPFLFSIGDRVVLAHGDTLPSVPTGGPYINAITPGYFATVGMHLIRGRSIAPADRAGSAPVTVINQALASRAFRDGDPLGACLRIGSDSACTTVIGVVSDSRRADVDEDVTLQLFVPLSQRSEFHGAGYLLIRPRGPVEGAMRSVRQVLQEAAPRGSDISVVSLREIIDPQFRPWRLAATLFTVFAAFAVTLAVAGVFLVTSFVAVQRTPEFAVRVALGAPYLEAPYLALREAVGVCVVGVLAGVVAVVVATPYTAPLLYRTSPLEARLLLLSTGMLVVVTICAAFVPVRRLTRIDLKPVIQAA